MEFNAGAVRIINRTAQRCAELEQRQQELEQRQQELEQRQQELEQRQQELEVAFSSFKRESDKTIADCIFTVKSELDSKIESTSTELTTVKANLDSKIELSVKEHLTLMDEEIHTRTWLAHVLEERVQKGLAQKSAPPPSVSKNNTNYFLFEEQFRGSREVITQRQLAFLPYFENCSRVLDIGCGRGEFLDILKDHGIGGIGVDSDPDMVIHCRSRQLEVELSDAIADLETLEDNSLDGIFIDQVVEHLMPDYLIRLLALCHNKMKTGSHIVIETVNPLSFVSFVNFYIDMTHTKPVHPETLQYLVSASGFRECEMKFFSPVPDEGRLKKVKGIAEMNETERKNLDVYNHNVERLNKVLFGAQDYAVIGKK
jgi:SAM-dependent methyltransferase